MSPKPAPGSQPVSTKANMGVNFAGGGGDQVTLSTKADPDTPMLDVRKPRSPFLSPEKIKHQNQERFERKQTEGRLGVKKAGVRERSKSMENNNNNNDRKVNLHSSSLTKVESEFTPRDIPMIDAPPVKEAGKDKKDPLRRTLSGRVQKSDGSTGS